MAITANAVLVNLWLNYINFFIDCEWTTEGNRILCASYHDVDLRV